MKKSLFLLLMLFYSICSNAQYTNICDAAYADFNTLMETFLQFPTDALQNEEIYYNLEELQNTIRSIHVSQEERYQLNSLSADIDVVKDFLAPISNQYNAHLSKSNMERLRTIFGQNFLEKKLNVRCPSNEIEFIEVRLGDLVICYFHCISKKVENGLRIRFYSASGSMKDSGEHGAKKNEYVPISHNVGKKYLRVNSAKIIKRF